MFAVLHIPIIWRMGYIPSAFYYFRMAINILDTVIVELRKEF